MGLKNYFINLIYRLKGKNRYVITMEYIKASMSVNAQQILLQQGIDTNKQYQRNILPDGSIEYIQ
jgi:hypothetical protein